MLQQVILVLLDAEQGQWGGQKGKGRGQVPGPHGHCQIRPHQQGPCEAEESQSRPHSGSGLCQVSTALLLCPLLP